MTEEASTIQKATELTSRDGRITLPSWMSWDTPIVAPRLFGLALILATAIPFFAGGFSNFAQGRIFVPIQATISLLALIHVPMTVYLLFDRDIRTQLWNRPLTLIGVPVLIFVACFAIFSFSAKAQLNGKAWYIAYVLIGIVAWNFWHFGKQNIGVCSFLRLAQSRPGMAPTERKMLLLAAFLGAAVTVPAAAETSIRTYAQGHDYLYLLTISKYVTPILTFIQYGLLIFSAVYVFLNRQRFTKTGAAVFLMSVNFFLYFYIKNDQPSLSLILMCTTLGHGLQYLVFLAAHSLTYNTARQPTSSSTLFNKIKMPLIFVITILLVSDYYRFNYIIPAKWLDNLLFLLTATSSPIRNIGFGMALTNSILLTHFWLDSYFWRFKDKPARDWMISRYAFLFKKKP